MTVLPFTRLRGHTFERIEMSAATFRDVDLCGARFERVTVTGAVLRGVELCDVQISGELKEVSINGVDVVPLVEAELDRRYPDRPKMQPEDAAGFREAWDIVERLWDGTVARARGLPPDLLHERIDGEWSFIQTLRHLVFATDAWVRRVMLGDPAPWDALDLPFEEMRDRPGVPRDRDARPSLDEVLTLRRDRMDTVRQVIDDLDDDMLDGRTEPVDAPGWPAADNYPVRGVLLCILNEEWQHRLYAERDLDVLESGSS
ncbi:DinB family protein [soil metagenome]